MQVLSINRGAGRHGTCLIENQKGRIEMNSIQTVITPENAKNTGNFEQVEIAAVEQAGEDAAQEVIESFIPDMEGEENLYEYRISLSNDAKEELEMYMGSVGIEWEMIE